MKKRKGGQPKDDGLDIGERVRALRFQRAISQQEIAKRAGLSQSAIAQIENGQRDPSLGTLSKIAGALKVSLASLVTKGHEVIIDLDEIRNVESSDDLESGLFKNLSLLLSEIDRLKLN